MTNFPESLPAAQLIGPLRGPAETEIRAVAITTLNGAAAVSGNTQTMGNSTDSELFQAVRRWSDVVLVGAGTVRDENYGGVLLSEGQRAERTAGGQDPVPAIAVLTRSLALNPAMRLFAEATTPPLLLLPHTTFADPALAAERRALIDAGAEILDCGDASACTILETLHYRGFRRIDLEGGPTAFAEFFAEDRVDVLHLTLESRLHAPLERPLLDLPEGSPALTRRLTLEHLAATADGTVFLRYRSPRGRGH